MKNLRAVALALFTGILGTAGFAQSFNLSSVGGATTPGVTQPASPNPTFNSPQNAVQNIQNLQTKSTTSASGNPVSSLGFSSINVSAPIVYPSRFGTSNVLSTQSPQATVAQPMSQIQSSTAATTISPAISTFTFTPSQQFQPVVTPSPYNPPSTNGFRAR